MDSDREIFKKLDKINCYYKVKNYYDKITESIDNLQSINLFKNKKILRILKLQQNRKYKQLSKLEEEIKNDIKSSMMEDRIGYES